MAPPSPVSLLSSCSPHPHPSVLRPTRVPCPIPLPAVAAQRAHLIYLDPFNKKTVPYLHPFPRILPIHCSSIFGDRHRSLNCYRFGHTLRFYIHALIHVKLFSCQMAGLFLG